MEHDSSAQRPEGVLLRAAQKASGSTIRSVAAEAGMSEGRWRQIVKGSMTVQGTVVPMIAPAATLARMAQVVGVTGDQLRDAGRQDAAEALENPAVLQELEKPSSATPSRRASVGNPQLNDEIEMIYKSNMTAEQRLRAISMVLQLHAEVEAATAEVTATAFNATVITDQAAPADN